MKNVFIVGSKGIPAKYGGFETFVECLTDYKKDAKIQYHVACTGDDKKEIIYNQARCFFIKVPNIGPAKAIYYDVMALKECFSYIKEHNLSNSTIYILACRIGPFLPYFNSKAKKLNTKLFLNPDGQEWKRAKWNYFIRKYWKISERLMIKYSDLIICDSQNIEKYVIEEYKKYKPNTCFIPYGANVVKYEKANAPKVALRYTHWLREHSLIDKEFYLIVGRFVPENNVHIIIEEFIKSKSDKQLVIITNVVEGTYLTRIKKATKYQFDNRIQFVGTIYDQEVLALIRQHAHAYLHGHEVGGTNPSLLEALAITNINLLLDVSFNKEVGSNSAFYWTKEKGDLAKLIDRIDVMSIEAIKEIGKAAKQRIEEAYSWDSVIADYEKILRE